MYRHGNRIHAEAIAKGDPAAAFRLLTVPFYKPGIVLHVYAGMIVTVVVLAGTSNAVNLTDGMDGLAAGCVALCSFVFMVLSYLVGDAEWSTRMILRFDC